MGPVLEESMVLPEEPIQVGAVVLAQPAPQDQAVAGGNRTDGIELETAQMTNHVQHGFDVRLRTRGSQSLRGDGQPARGPGRDGSHPASVPSPVWGFDLALGLESFSVAGFWFWVITAIAFAVVEVLTLAFFAVFITIGAIGAALASLLGFNLLVQAIVLGVVGVLGIATARPFLVQRLHIGRHALRSGAESMIGQQGVLSEPILGSSRPGHLQIAGELWPAVTEDASAVPAETPVVVTGLRGSTLIVRVAPSTPTPSA